MFRGIVCQAPAPDSAAASMPSRLGWRPLLPLDALPMSPGGLSVVKSESAARYPAKWSNWMTLPGPDRVPLHTEEDGLPRDVPCPKFQYDP